MAASSRPNPLAGLPLDYLIGVEGDDPPGQAGRITEMPYEAGPAANGISIGYCNLRREDGEPEEYGPYLPHDELFNEYPEGRPDPNGPGFRRNIIEQLDRCKQQGHTVVEQDNPDSYDLMAVMQAVDLACERKLDVVAKNPKLVKGDALVYVRHPSVVGIIVEKDCGTPTEMDELRRRAGKPALPVWFVSFKGGRNQAMQAAKDIATAGFVNMGVTYSRKGEYETSEDILLPRAAASPLAAQAAHAPGSSSAMPQLVTPADILAKARSFKGQIVGDSHQIVDLARAIGSAYPDMVSGGYIAELHEDTEWCGIFNAYVHTLLGIRPAYTKNSSDYDDFAWADAPIEGHWGTPVTQAQALPGDTVVLRVPHHITFLDKDNGDGTFQGTGGNQGGGGGAVTTATFKWANIRGIVRAPQPNGDLAEVPLVDDPGQRPIIKLGDIGPYVIDLKKRLGLPVNASFDAATDAAVRAYQASRGLPDVDGEVGPDTWGALLGGAPATSAAATAGPLPQSAIDQILALARNSPARTGWNNGTMPVGCCNGLAVSYGIAYRDLKAGASAALAMARPLGGTSTDALASYGVNASDPVELLRANFQLIFGSAMRESSGNYSEGVDVKAGIGRPADEIEAGLLQQSYNSFHASPELPKLFALWRNSADDGLRSIFAEGVTDLHRQDFGSGDGVVFQHLAKTKPLFAVYAAAIGQRVLRTHWGPISRHEAQMRPQVAELLSRVEAIVDALPPVVVPHGPTTTQPAPSGRWPWPRPWAQPQPHDSVLADILQRIKGLEHTMNGTVVPPPGSSTMPTALPHIDLARIEQDIARLGQIAGTFSQFANTIGQIPTAGLPPQLVQIEQTISRLGQVAGSLSQFATQLAAHAPVAGGTAAPTTPPLSPIDKMLGGPALVGLKTPLAIGGMVLMWVLQAAGVMGTATGTGATATGQILTSLIGGFGAMGVTAKFDRAFQALSTISGLLQKLPRLSPPPPPAGGSN